MVFITHCDSPAFWQTYLSDPASITMEGILIFNKHLLFLLTVIVLFVAWLLLYNINYFIKYNNKFSSKFVHSKELEILKPKTLVFFFFKLDEKRKTKKLLWKFFLEGERARHESEEDFAGIRRWRDAHSWKLVVNIWVKENINLREGDPGNQAAAQIYLTNNVFSRPAPEYRLEANRDMADVSNHLHPDQDVINEVKHGWHLHSPSGWHSNLLTWEIQAVAGFDINVYALTPNEPLPQFGITNSIITVRD